MKPKRKKPIGLIIVFVAVLIVLVFFVGALASTIGTPPPTPVSLPLATYDMPGDTNMMMTGCNSAGECNNLCWDGEAFVTCAE